MRLQHKTAIVTGAAQGIRASYAVALAEAGAAVGVWDIDDPSATVATIEAAGGRAHGRRVDIVDPEAVAAATRETAEVLGGPHILVNNAALFAKLKNQPFTEIPGDEWDRVMLVNVRGPMECVKAVLPYMRAQSYALTLIADGGIRRGSDILKCLAFGADFVFVGRPMLYAAAARGEAGVAQAIALLKAELDRNMAMLGLVDLAAVGPEIVCPASGFPGSAMRKPPLVHWPGSLKEVIS